MPQVEGHDALVGCFAQCGVEARGRLPAAPLLRGDGLRHLAGPRPQDVEVPGRKVC